MSVIFLLKIPSIALDRLEVLINYDEADLSGFSHLRVTKLGVVVCVHTHAHTSINFSRA